MEVERYSHVLHLVSHVEGRLKPELDALDALRSVFPAGTLSGAPKIRAMQLIAAAEGRAARPVRRRGRLPRLRRQPRHGHHHPERGAQGRPGARPYRRRDRRRLRAGEASSRRPSTRRPPSGGRSRWRPASPRRPRPERHAGERGRRDRARSRHGHDPRHRQLRQLHVQPRPGAPGGGRRGPRRAQRRDRRSRRSRRWPTTRPPTCAGSSSRPVPATRTMPGSRSGRSGSPPTAACRCSASASGCSRWRPHSARRIVRAPTLVHGEATEVTHDGAGLLEGMPPAFMAARYHSLAVDAATLPPELRVTAMSEVDRVVMGIRHVALPLEGVQFHPESVLTPQGPHLLANFLRQAGEGEASRLDDAIGLVRHGRAGRGGRGRRPMSDARPRRPRHDRRRRHAVDGRGARRDGRGDGRRGDAGPARGAAHGPADARRDGRRAGRVRARDARARHPRRRARRRDRRRRHRRRRQRHVQHLDDGRPRRRRGRRAGRQARQPRDHLAGRARRTSSTPSASGSITTPRRPARRCASIGFAFLFAPNFHPGDEARRPDPHARSASGPRSTCIGPLTNPAGTRRQLLGVGDAAVAARMAEVVQRLGTERTFVIHGDGVDELPLDGSGVPLRRRRTTGRAPRDRRRGARVQARGDRAAGRWDARGERADHRGRAPRRARDPPRRRAAQRRGGAARGRRRRAARRRGSSGPR